MRFCYRQSNVHRILPASDYCGECIYQIVVQISDNDNTTTTVLDRSGKLGGPPKI